MIRLDFGSIDVEGSRTDKIADVTKLLLSFFGWPRFGDTVAFTLFSF